MTVVDGSSFLDELHAADTLRGRGWEAAEEDERTVAQLFCDQLEFANVIVMNKMDLMDDEGRARLRAILRRFNPGAQLVEATWGRVDPKRILGTGLFDMDEAEKHPEWLKEARVGEHTPESIEYGISSFTFNSRRPFDVARFEKLTEAMEAHAKIAGIPRLDAAKAGEEEARANSGDASVKAARQVIRAKGLVWLANRRSHWQQGIGSLAGRNFTIAFSAPWAAAVDSAGPQQNEVAELPPDWEAPWGDRRTELVVIGQNMDHGAMRAALEACVVNEEEMMAYTESFRDDTPVFTPYERRLPGDTGDMAERLKRYHIEILAPKRKKTQILASTPKATEVLSAHCCLAKFEGCIEGTAAKPGRIARFQVVQYLRYAHLFPELASGLVKNFEFPIATADGQTAILAQQTSGLALSNAIANLNVGDKVELEWRQIRVEMDTDVDEDRFSIVEQCNKLVKLDASDEAALLQQFPQPQIMIRKQQKAVVTGRGKTTKGMNSTNETVIGTGKETKKKKKKKGKKGRRKR